MGIKGRRWAMTVGEKIAGGLAEAVEYGDCLEWQGPYGCHGVTPIVKARHEGNTRTDNFPVARLLWEAAYGPLEPGQMVYRTCCNNACILLDHLQAGTRKEWAKNRKKAGLTKHEPSTIVALTLAARKRSTAVNSLEKARDVRSLARDGLDVEEIAERTGVSLAMVGDIRQGRAWKEPSNPFSGLGAR